MHPVLYKIGNQFTIYSYGVCLCLALFFGFLIFWLKTRRTIENYERVFILFAITIISGFAGAYLLFVIVNWELYAEPELFSFSIRGFNIKIPDLRNFLQGGMVYYGGIIGGILGGGIASFYLRFSILEIADLSAPAISMSHLWGRVGCFLAGCCYGIPCNSTNPLCVKYPQGAIAYNDMMELHLLNPDKVPNDMPSFVPTQIIESFFEGILSIFLMYFYGRRLVRGQVIGLYFIFYGLFRFFIEFFRFDPLRGRLGALSTSQWISILLFITGSILTSRKISSKVNS
jgi:phosphatidylglycerol:prolipoprotein diacylglycerol transferase